VLSQINRELQ